jgi:medium-chain acyl-[acyl-carrier-protein] hydrolase
MATSGSWVKCSRQLSGVHVRLFCFPYAGAGASIFRAWPEGLPDTIEVCPIQLPGREHRLTESPFTQMAALVRTLCEVLEPMQTEPFAFFGHSLGAMIGFELANQLRAYGSPGPSHLFVSSCRAPQLPDLGPPRHLLSDADLVSELRRLRGTPEAALANAELMELMLPILRADFRLFETYQYVRRAPLDCPISVFGGRHDPRTTRFHLNAWRVQTRSTFKLRLFPGDHFFLHTAQKDLLQAIAEDLEPIAGGSGE